MIIRRRVSLPYPSFLTAWLALDLGQLPTALLPATIGTPAGTLEEITERAWEDLFERDLTLGRTLDEGFAGTLSVLARAASRYYAFFHEGDGDTRSVIVAGSKVVAEINGDTVTLRPSRSDSAKTLVDALPRVPRAPGEPLSAPAGQQDARMRGLLTRPRTGGGQIYVARRDQVCDRPLSYLDTEAGRLIAVEHATGWRSLIPADAATLRRRISEMMSDVTARARVEGTETPNGPLTK